MTKIVLHTSPGWSTHHSVQDLVRGQWFETWRSQAQIWLHNSSYCSYRTEWILLYILFYMREVIIIHKHFYKNKNEIQCRFLNIKQEKLNSCEVTFSGMSPWWSLFPKTLLSTVGPALSETSIQRLLDSKGTCKYGFSYLMKTSPARSLHFWRVAKHWTLSWPHSVISIEHRPPTMKLGLSWVFLVAILKGDLWRTECVIGDEWEEQWVLVRVSWPELSIFASVHCEV
jgi:hypothetical protein